MTRSTLIVLFFLSSFQSVQLTAQDKIERERRVKKSEVPKEEREWMRGAYENTRRIKWYYEETSGKSSYEAKIKVNNRQISVEFNTSGIIEDIEIQIEADELPQVTAENIMKYFQKEYRKFDLRKIQEQWTGEPEDLEDAVDENEMDDIVIMYEIEYYGVSDSDKSLWEGLFDSEGNFIKKRKIVLRPADNLNF